MSETTTTLTPEEEKANSGENSELEYGYTLELDGIEVKELPDVTEDTRKKPKCGVVKFEKQMSRNAATGAKFHNTLVSGGGLNIQWKKVSLRDQNDELVFSVENLDSSVEKSVKKSARKNNFIRTDTEKEVKVTNYDAFYCQAVSKLIAHVEKLAKKSGSSLTTQQVVSMMKDCGGNVIQDENLEPNMTYKEWKDEEKKKKDNGRIDRSKMQGDTYSIYTPATNNNYMFYLSCLVAKVNGYYKGDNPIDHLIKDHFTYVCEFEKTESTDNKASSPASSGNTSDENVTKLKVFQNLQDMIDKDKYQIILTGAPGTGKSYLSKQLAYYYIGQYKDKAKQEQSNKLYQVYSEQIKKKDQRLKTFITEILNDISPYTHSLEKIYSKKEEFSAVFGTAGDDKFQNLCLEIYGDNQDETSPQEKFWQDVERLRGAMSFVQFHPSYDYSDFVDGIRPVPSEEGGKMDFRRVDGTFMAFCRYVAWRNEMLASNSDSVVEKDQKYFFLIDEINRADLSKVLGELMYCLEHDKRGSTNMVKTQYHNLPSYFPKEEVEVESEKSHEFKEEVVDLSKKSHEFYEISKKSHEFYENCFKSGFYIPENVVLIGTMNDIDRSVESMDFALRRRFDWYEVEVNEDSLKQAFQIGKMFSFDLEDKFKLNTENGIQNLSELEEEKSSLDEDINKAKETKDNIKELKNELEICQKNINTLQAVTAQTLENVGNYLAITVNFFNENKLESNELGKEYYISQGYFSGYSYLSDIVYDESTQTGTAEEKIAQFAENQGRILAKNILASVWDSRVKSLLKEYLRGTPQVQNVVDNLEKSWNRLKTTKTSQTTSNENQGDEMPQGEDEDT